MEDLVGSAGGEVDTPYHSPSPLVARYPLQRLLKPGVCLTGRFWALTGHCALVPLADLGVPGLPMASAQLAVEVEVEVAWERCATLAAQCRYLLSIPDPCESPMLPPTVPRPASCMPHHSGSCIGCVALPAAACSEPAHRPPAGPNVCKAAASVACCERCGGSGCRSIHSQWTASAHVTAGSCTVRRRPRAPAAPAAGPAAERAAAQDIHGRAS